LKLWWYTKNARKITQKSNGSLKENKNVKWLSDGTNDYPHKNNNGGGATM
jgi:hypothetical protein